MAKPACKPPLLTKDQRAEIERELSTPFGTVKLTADGHELTLRVVPVKPLKYAVSVYVDGWLRGEWWKAESDIGAKFWCRRVRNCFPQKEQLAFRKALGKRAGEKMIERGTYVRHEPFFVTARACLASLQRTCASIEVVSIGYQSSTAPELSP